MENMAHGRFCWKPAEDTLGIRRPPGIFGELHFVRETAPKHFDRAFFQLKIF